MSWLVAYTNPFRESLVDARFRSLGIPTFLPQRNVRRHRRNSPIELRPIFPCYCFLDAPIESWRSLRRVPNVIDFCRMGDEVLILPEPVLLELRARCDERGVIPPVPIREGDLRMINNGNPASGLLILIEKIAGAQATGWIGNLRARVPVADLDIETGPVLSSAAKGRISRPLSDRRKARNWEPLA